MRDEWITCHGWGLSASIFSKWEERIPDSVVLDHCDRGYLGPERMVGFTPRADRKILLVHSFGLHWCPDELIDLADRLVILSGFSSFHPANTRQQRLSRFGVTRMLEQLERNPAALVREFQRRVYDPVTIEELEWNELNTDLLQRDLQRLDEVDLDPARFRHLSDVTIVGGGADRILQPDCRDELLACLPANTREILYSREGHAAGLLNPGPLFSKLDSSVSDKTTFHGE